MMTRTLQYAIVTAIHRFIKHCRRRRVMACSSTVTAAAAAAAAAAALGAKPHLFGCLTL